MADDCPDVKPVAAWFVQFATAHLDELAAALADRVAAEEPAYRPDALLPGDRWCACAGTLCSIHCHS